MSKCMDLQRLTKVLKLGSPTILGRVYNNTVGRLSNLTSLAGGGNETPPVRSHTNQPAKSYIDEQGRRLYTEKDVQREIGRRLEDSEKRQDAKLREVEESYTYQIDMLTAQLESQKEIVSGAQESALKFLKETKTVAMDDGQIQSKLEGMATSWRSWAKDNAHKNIERVTELKDEERMKFLTSVKDFIQVGDKGIPDEFITPGRGSITPAIILQGMLANLICTKLISQPFLFLGKSEALKSPGKKRTFSWMYRQLLAGK
jgi:hypothetical protein